MLIIPGNPIDLLIPVLLIPLIYAYLQKRKESRGMLILFLTGAVMVLLYPLTSYLSDVLRPFGYSLGKLLIFVALPVAALFCIERWGIRDILIRTGLRKTNLPKSLLYGLGAAAVTITISLLTASYTNPDLAWRIIMFFEAFTEEFFFRGVLLIYLARKTSLRVAYLTSVLGFVLIHPQNFGSLFITSTIAQAVLLAIIADRTGNVIGPWISHGLNRLVPPLIRSALG